VLMAPVRSALEDRHNIFVAGRQTPATKRPKDHRTKKQNDEKDGKSATAGRREGERDRGFKDVRGFARRCCEGKGSRESTRRPTLRTRRVYEGRKEGRKEERSPRSAVVRGWRCWCVRGAGDTAGRGRAAFSVQATSKSPCRKFPPPLRSLAGRRDHTRPCSVPPRARARARARVHSDGAFQAGVPEFRSR